MKRTWGFLLMSLGLATGMLWAQEEVTPAGVSQGNADIIQKAEQSMALIIVGDGGGRVLSVSAGAIIRPEGILLAAYRPVKGAKEVQVRLSDGEIYDQVDLMGFDERRDVAALRFTASGLVAFTAAGLQEATMGERIRVLNADGAMAWSSCDGVLGPVRPADEVMGAGHGYRVIQFMAPIPQGALGGALVNARGQLLGIITGSQNNGGQQFAVPVESVLGLASQGLRVALGTGKNLAPSTAVANSAAAPEEQPRPFAALANAHSLRVITKTTFFNPAVLDKELMNNMEFRLLGLSVVEGPTGGELLVIVNRPLFTYTWTYSVTDSQTGVVLASGKVSAFDGARAARGIVPKLLQDFEEARAVQAPQTNSTEALAVRP